MYIPLKNDKNFPTLPTLYVPLSPSPTTPAQHKLTRHDNDNLYMNIYMYIH